jgi:hypothetical protein
MKRKERRKGEGRKKERKKEEGGKRGRNVVMFLGEMRR